jgi:peptide/nickel transport system permease protein
LTRFLAKRILIALVQIFVVSVLVFSLTRIMPGDPVILALGTERDIDPAIVTEMRHTLGLDAPVTTQYVKWIAKVVTKFDLGNSIIDQTPVTEYILQRIPRTIELAIAAITIALALGVIFGLIAALKRQTPVDLITTSAAAFGISLPAYVLGTLMVIVFSLNLNWLPASGFVEITEDGMKHFTHLLLPAVAIALGLAASIARQTRSSVLEVLNKEFVQTVRAKGLPERQVIFKHVFRNALIPIVTIVGLQLGNLIGGTVLIEYLFNWPGLSTLLVNSISQRDYPIIQGCILVVSTFYITINMAVDVIYGILDPRVR